MGQSLKPRPPVGSPPVLEWLRPADLRVDESYQRTLQNSSSEALIRRIAMNWDWGLCQPINVARRADGSLWIVDGQHRRAAAELRGDIAHLPCVVQSFATAEQEAAAFVALNKQRRLTGVDVFKAALVAGDAEARAVLDLICAAGLSLAPHSNYTAWTPGMLYCVPAIAAGYRRHGKRIVSVALAAMSEAFQGTILQHAGNIIEGLFPFVASEPLSLTKTGLVEMLQTHSQSEWVRRCRLRMSSEGVGRKDAMRVVFASEWGARIGKPADTAPIVDPQPVSVTAAALPAGREWCEQCDRMVSPTVASFCKSRFCSLRSPA